MPDFRNQADREAQAKDRLDAQWWVDNAWGPLTARRYEAAARGESSPWTGLAQWAVEIPLNANMRGAGQDTGIAEREAAFEAEMARLRRLANPQGSEGIAKGEKPRSPWSGIK